jgi:uncharacterized protein
LVLLGLVLAAIVGLALGLLGGGGSILTVPIFAYVLGYGAKQAIAMGLAVVGTTSLVGALRHWQAGNVNLRVALSFGAVAMAGTYLGARLAVFVSGAVQLVLFASVMLVAAAFMFRSDKSNREKRSVRVFPARGTAQVPRRDGAAAAGAVEPLVVSAAALPFGLLAAVGLGVGLLTGLVGVGGGFLIVPALVLLAHIPMKEAVGTSLLVIAMNAATGFAGYLGQVEIDWTSMILFATVASAGIFAGAHLVRLVTQEALRRGFAGFLVAMGLFILYQNRAVFLWT